MAAYSFEEKILTPRYVLLYIVLAALACGSAVYFFWGREGLGLSPGKNSVKSGQLGPAKTWQIGLSAQNKSDISGKALLSEMGGKTTVLVSLTSSSSGTPMPAVIYFGTCGHLSGVRYPLANAVYGQSNTVLPVTIDGIKKQGYMSINILKSPIDVNIVVSCGDLK